MKKSLMALTWSVAFLCACGTPLAWRGPPGTTEQELGDVKRQCLTRAQSWRSLNEAVYEASAVLQPEYEIKTGYFYRGVDQIFRQCMHEHGYALAPRE